MCGICGILNFDKSEHVDGRVLRDMADSIAHRGPDDHGYYTSSNLGLGFRRLSIIDLESGHQPLSNEDGTIWIVFNGEIYNYRELRQDLVRKGHRFKTHSDTEVIVHLYEEYGRECVDFLRGMFAFAIWNDKKKTLYCARDRFGIKPFFYLLKNRKFVFASEIKGVLKSGASEEELDLRSLDCYLTYKYIGSDRTIYKDVRKLKPAHWMEVRSGSSGLEVIERKYWNIRHAPDFTRDENDWAEELRHELSEAVRLRLVSDVPLGAFLSGGVDSSIVVALMSQYSESPVKTFSIGFKEKEYNELPYARDVAKLYETDHHEKIIEPDSVDLLPNLLSSYDEPFADSSAIATYYVSKFAREHVTVVLSGDGGDELFAGYNNYPRLTKLNRYNVIPHRLGHPLWAAINRLVPNGVRGNRLTYYLSKSRDDVAAYFALWSLPERRRLYKPDMWKQISDNFAEKYKIDLLSADASNDYLFKIQALDMKTFLVDDILTKVDRASMTNSLEVRVPLLDHKVAELSFRMPSCLKLRGAQRKYILKRATADILPDSVISHKKQGFTVPLNMWFKDSLRDYVNDRLNSRNNALATYINLDYVNSTIGSHNRGLRDMNEKIWSLIVLDAWLEKHRS